MSSSFCIQKNLSTPTTEPILAHNAVRLAFLRLFSASRINDLPVLGCLYEAKTGLTFNTLVHELVLPSGGVGSASLPGYWVKGALKRLEREGFVAFGKFGPQWKAWSITTAGRVMIARLNQEALKILAERQE